MNYNRPLNKRESVFALAVAALTVWAGVHGWPGPILFWGFVAVLAFVFLRACWGLARFIFG